MAEHGTFFWNQLVTTNQRISGDFYCSLFGWSRRELDLVPFGLYTFFQQNGKDVGGMMDPATDYSRARPSGWEAVIAVADVDAIVSRVMELGGTIIDPPRDVPGVGRACLIADPMGAPVCLMTSLLKTVNPQIMQISADRNTGSRFKVSRSILRSFATKFLRFLRLSG